MSDSTLLLLVIVAIVLLGMIAGIDIIQMIRGGEE